MSICNLSVPNNSGKRCLRAITTPSPGAAPLFSASSRCSGWPDPIPIVTSFSDSLGCLGDHCDVCEKMFPGPACSISSLNHLLPQRSKRTPTEDTGVLLPGPGSLDPTPFLGLLQNGNLRKQLLLIGQENYILIGCLLTLQCNFWSQQNVESLEWWCCVPKCGISLVRRITGKGRATWAMLLDPFKTPSFINCGTH